MALVSVAPARPIWGRPARVCPVPDLPDLSMDPAPGAGTGQAPAPPPMLHRNNAEQSPSAGPREALCEAAEIASGPDAPAHLCSRAERRGARPARSGPARVGRVHRAPGADRAGERGGTPAAGDRARPALCGADGPQRRPRFNAAGLAALTAGSSRPRSAAPVLGEAERERLRAILHQPPRLRPPEEHLDPRPPGAGGARARAEPGRPLGGDDPAGVAAARGGLEAGQALADQPRSRLRAKKRRRDRLIGLARGRPGWASGFQDEVWFSRFAQPSLHAWAADGERPRLAAHAADPEPKALARYGLWLPGPERMLLRFVAGGAGGGPTPALPPSVVVPPAPQGGPVLGPGWGKAPPHGHP